MAAVEPAPETVLATTKALCPRCRVVCPAETIEREGRVVMRRTCPRHGTQESLVLSDASWWRWSRAFARPGRRPVAVTAREHGCPYDCGFCPDHDQHACVTVLEITEACNLACPACFAGDAHVTHASLEDVQGMVNGLLHAEGGAADVVMLSGGEPTLHPQFLEVADLVRSQPVRYVIVNSNGLRIARDPDFAREIAARGLLVYLQFDGFDPATYRTLRGRDDLLDIKLRALDHLTAAGARVVLVATVVKGVNDGEVGALVQFGARHPAVRAVSLQPQFGEGRYVPFDPMDRMTLTDVIEAVDRDSGIFTRRDFVPVPCCDPMCTAATYAYVVDGNVTPVTQLVPVETYLQYLENAAMPNLSEAYRTDAAEMREVLLRLYSKSAPPGTAAAGIGLLLCLRALPRRSRLGGRPARPHVRRDHRRIHGSVQFRRLARLALLHPRSAARRTHRAVLRVQHSVSRRPGPATDAAATVTATLPGTPPELKCACAELWAHPVAQLLAGPALRPGGRMLTSQILDRLRLARGARVLDVGSGTGATLSELRRRGIVAIGVDYSTDLVTLARDEAPVVQGDGEVLPFATTGFDGVFSECVLSALPDKHAALSEARRVLVPGGTLVVTDMVVNGPFPEPLRTVAAWAACIGGAHSTNEYVALLDAHGFVPYWQDDATAHLVALVDQAERRLAMLQGAMAVGIVSATDDVFGTLLAGLGAPLTSEGIAQLANVLFSQVRNAIANEQLGYVAMIAR